ncbi:MAG TPA: hypothetical protein VFQ23_24295 [Anaerolineales bacterium]|nr:hypothetical protein [Anaerolineales bacterium]
MEDSQSSERTPVPDRWSRLLWAGGIVMLLLIVAAVSGYTWIALYGPCSVNTVESASNSMLDQLELFDEMYQSIPTLSPLELFEPMTQLQQILIDTKKVVVPTCLQTAHLELTTAMESLMRALLAIMESKPESTSAGLFEKSNKHRDNFTAELEWINKCSPFCPR